MWRTSPGSWASPWSPSPPRPARDWTSCSRWPTGRCTWAIPLSLTTCTTASPTTSTTAWGLCFTTTPTPPISPPTGRPSSCWRGTSWWRRPCICPGQCRRNCKASSPSMRAPVTWATGRPSSPTAAISTSSVWSIPLWSGGTPPPVPLSASGSTGWSPASTPPSPCSCAPCWPCSSSPSAPSAPGCKTASAP